MITKQTTTDTVHLSQNETMTATMMMKTTTATKTTVNATTQKKNYTKYSGSHSFLSYNHLCRNPELRHNFSYILK
jgi:hypothetical protein